jgi:hypothetical protein
VAYLVRPWIVSYVNRKTGKRVPKGTPGAKRVRRRSRKLYAAGVPGWPKGKRVPLASDKTAASQMLAELVRQAERGMAGIADRFQEHRPTPIGEHVAAWRRALESKGNTGDYVELAAGRVRDLIAGCEFTVLADIDADRVGRWLADLRQDKPPVPLAADVATVAPGELAARLGVTVAAVWQQGRRLGLGAEGRGRARRYSRAAAEQILARAGRGASVQTANYYLGAFKSFCRWLVRDRRIPENPVEHVQGGNPKMDRRHDRRELAVGELLRVLDAARVSPAVFRGLAGADRFHLYLTACGTGFRVDELAALTPESFALTSDPPTASQGSDPAASAGRCRGPRRVSRRARRPVSPFGRAGGRTMPRKCCGSTWRPLACPTSCRGRMDRCSPTSTL